MNDQQVVLLTLDLRPLPIYNPHLRMNRTFRFACAGSFLIILGCLAGCRSEPEAPRAAPSASPADPAPTALAAVQRILFFGNSLTAGLGLDPAQAFPALIQEKIDALGWPYEVVNAGLSGETTAGGLRRVDWVLQQPADVFVLELGANDGLRGISTTDTQQNLQAIIDKARAANPDVQVILAGMQIPPNLGGRYTAAFKDVFPTLARQNEAALIPFLLDGVAGDPTLNLPDGVHPNAEGHRILAENVWAVLKPLLAPDGA